VEYKSGIEHFDISFGGVLCQVNPLLKNCLYMLCNREYPGL